MLLNLKYPLYNIKRNPHIYVYKEYRVALRQCTVNKLLVLLRCSCCQYFTLCLLWPQSLNAKYLWMALSGSSIFCSFLSILFRNPKSIVISRKSSSYSSSVVSMIYICILRSALLIFMSFHPVWYQFTVTRLALFKKKENKQKQKQRNAKIESDLQKAWNLPPRCIRLQISTSKPAFICGQKPGVRG